MRPSATNVVLLFAIGVAGSGCHQDPPRLDAAHLPRELLGLVPGVADEAAASAALAGAEETKDKRLGGKFTVELNGEPAIAFVNHDAHTQAWLVKLGDVPRVAMVSTRVTDKCASALATLGDHVTQGTCGSSNRRFSADEHEMCAASPDGKYLISIECVGASGELSLWLRFNDSGEHSTMINRN